MSTKGTTTGQRWVLALTSAASLMVSLDTQVVATALPVVRLKLHASLATLEMLAAVVGLFAAASAACALAQNATELIVARAVQGAGAG